MQDEQAWVLYVHDGFLDPEVKRLAGEWRGLVRFGMLDVGDKEALSMLTRKQQKFLDTDGFRAALEHAAASVPDDFLTVLNSEKDTKTLLSEAIASKPSRFTVLFTVKDDKPTLLHKVLSRKLIRNFNFALLPQADQPDALKSAGLTGLTASVPGMSVLMVTKSGSVRSSRMTDAATSQGYVETLRFLVEFNRQFRPELPGDARTGDPNVLYMSDILDAERIIFDVEDAAAPTEGGKDLKDEL
ncbi:hypothetical protein BOX15_Mlig015851g1 [Macrostomum lignano]|uniref:Uncharacterized protein n=1 Tax=Macrostomum lignano TaxID=282301 RepID=A0A267FRF8_9PLAT|nr:hypothetical protein BOX15_Mlig015851g1 [Macrostomum lignano]